MNVSHHSDKFEALIQPGWKGPVSLQVSSDESSYVYFPASKGRGFDGDPLRHQG